MSSLRWVAAAMVLTAACDNYEDVKIDREELPKGRLGETFEHQFEVTRAVDDAWFIDCRHSNDQGNLEMEMSREGKLTFEPTGPGEVKVCVEYRRREGEIDRIETSVAIDHAKGESPGELWASLGEFRPKLARVHEVVTAIANPRPSRCPELEAGAGHVYEEAWLTSIATDRPIPDDAKNTSAFRPLGYALWRQKEKGMQAGAKPTIERVKSPDYVVAVRIGEVTLPFVAPGDKFTMGRFRGHAVVVDLDTAEVKCTLPLAFQSSPTVEFTETTRREADGTEVSTNPLEGMSAIERDFAINGQTALKNAMKQGAPAIELVFGH